MENLKHLLLILICLSITGCATLFSEQEYVLVDQMISEKPVFTGMVYTIPERVNVRKIVLLGRGKVQNFDVYVRDEKMDWKFAKEVQGAIEFPFAIFVSAHTDGIKIAHRSVTGKGRIETIQFYTLADKVK